MSAAPKSQARASIRERAQTTSEQVVCLETDLIAEKNRRCVNWCFLVIVLAIFLICAALKVTFGYSSKVTYSLTKTANKTNPDTRSNEGPRYMIWDKFRRNIIPQEDIWDTEYSNQIDSINKSVDPCDIFYNYACQGWLERNPRPEYVPKWSVFSKLRTQNTKLVINILENPGDSTALHDAKQFYRKCVDIGSKKSENEDKATIQLMWNILEKYGGWPILYENGTWNKTRFDWIASMLALKQNFKSTTLLNVLPYQYHSWTKNTNAILISPPLKSISLSSILDTIDNFLESNKPLKSFVPFVKLQNLIVNISKVFLEFEGRTNINETYLEEMALDIILVHILLPSPGDPFKNISKHWDKYYLGVDNQTNVANVSLAKLQIFLDKNMLPFRNILNLLKILQALYKNTNVRIHKHQPVVITDLNYLLNLAKFVTEMAEEAIANYLSFRMTLLMIPLTGHKKLMSLLNDFENELSGRNGKRDRKEICAEITQENFSNTVGHAIYQLKFKSNELEFKQSKIIFDNLKVSFRKLIGSSNLEYFKKPVLEMKIKNTKLCLKYPSSLKKSWSRVSLEYSGLVINNSATFLEQNMAINSLAVDKSYGLLKMKSGNDDNCKSTKFAGDVEPYYDIVQESVYLPFGIMQPPFISIFMPTALMYGKLGSILGNKIIYSLIEPDWPKLEKGSLTPSGKCFVDQYNNASIPVTPQENSILNINIAGLLGAYKAYKESTLIDGNDSKKVDDLNEFSDEQLLFLGFAQNWCESSNQITLRQNLKNNNHPSEMFRVLGSLQNSEEFSKAWKCPLGSKMNPFQKCKTL